MQLLRLLTQLVLDLKADTNGTDTNTINMSRHTEMAHAYTCMQTFLRQSSSGSTTHPHTEKLLDLPAKLVANQKFSKKELVKHSAAVKKQTSEKKEVSMLKKVRQCFFFV